MQLYRPRDLLARGVPRIFVNFYSDSDQEAPEKIDEVAWELELDDWLIEHKFRSTSIENEQERWALHITQAFRPIINRYGDGYFNAVLINLIKNGPFAEHLKVKEMLKSIHENRPHVGSQADCNDMIDQQIHRLAERIRKLYDEDLDIVEDVLGGALADYLDERYSVSDRRALGWG